MNSTTVELAIVMALACCMAFGLQAWWLRRQNQLRLARQHQRHAQQQQLVSRNLDQAKRQIEQLQHELAAARLQVKRLSTSAGTQQQQAKAREALERSLDHATTARHRLPPDGFADTLPQSQYPEYIALMAR